MRSLNFVPTWVRPGLAEGDFAPVLFHRCRHHCVDIPTCFFLDVTVHAACSCHTGVVCSGAIQLHCVIIDLRAERTPVYPQGVVGPAIELDPRWTAGTCKRVSVELCFCKKKIFFDSVKISTFPSIRCKNITNVFVFIDPHWKRIHDICTLTSVLCCWLLPGWRCSWFHRWCTPSGSGCLECGIWHTLVVMSGR